MKSSYFFAYFAEEPKTEAPKTDQTPNQSEKPNKKGKKKKKKKNRPEIWAQQAALAEKRRQEEEEYAKKKKNEEENVEIEYVPDKLELAPSDPNFRYHFLSHLFPSLFPP